MSADPLTSLLSLYPPPFVHVHDPQNHLKYSTTFTSLTSTQRAFVSINSVECISQRVLFSRIINGLAKWTPDWEENCESWGGPVLGNWDSGFDAFAHALRQLWQEIQNLKKNEEEEGDKESQGKEEENEERMIVMFEKCERLKDFVPSLFIPLTRLAELVSTLYMLYLRSS